MQHHQHLYLVLQTGHFPFVEHWFNINSGFHCFSASLKPCWQWFWTDIPLFSRLAWAVKVFYETASHREEAMLLLDHHIKVFLPDFFPSAIWAKKVRCVQGLKRPSVCQRMLKDGSTYCQMTGSRSCQGIQMRDLRQGMGFQLLSIRNKWIRKWTITQGLHTELNRVQKWDWRRNIVNVTIWPAGVSERAGQIIRVPHPNIFCITDINAWLRNCSDNSASCFRWRCSNFATEWWWLHISKPWVAIASERTFLSHFTD